MCKNRSSSSSLATNRPFLFVRVTTCPFRKLDIWQPTCLKSSAYGLLPAARRRTSSSLGWFCCLFFLAFLFLRFFVFFSSWHRFCSIYPVWPACALGISASRRWNIYFCVSSFVWHGRMYTSWTWKIPVRHVVVPLNCNFVGVLRHIWIPWGYLLPMSVEYVSGCYAVVVCCSCNYLGCKVLEVLHVFRGWGALFVSAPMDAYSSVAVEG